MYQPLNLVGTRYVYFKTLPDDHPMMAKAQSVFYIGQMLTQTSNANDPSEKHLNNIAKYINFVKEMADAAKSNESAFLEQQLSALNKLDSANTQVRELLQGFETGNVDYKNLLLFNGLLQNADRDQAVIDRVRSNGRAIMQMFDRFPEEIRKKLEILYDSNMQEYLKLLDEEKKKLFGEKGQIQDYVSSYSRMFSIKINRILKRITTNNEFKKILIDTYNSNSNLNISDEQFKRIIVNYVIDQVLSHGSTLDNRDAVKIGNNIMNDIKNGFSEIKNKMENQDYIYAFDKIGDSLEERALTDRGSVGEFIAQLSDDSIKRIKEKYLKRGDKELSNLIDELAKLSRATEKDTKKISTVQAKVSKQLKQRIREKTKIPNTISPSAFNAKFKHLITPTRSQTDILHKIKSVSIAHDALAEAVGAHDVQQKIVKAICSKITGPTIQFKADVRCSTGYIDDDSLELFDPQEMEDIISSIINQYSDTFFLKYQQKSGGQTDVDIAMQAYEQWIFEMQQRIKEIVNSCDQINNKDAAIEEVYRAFEKTFSLSISVKDYDLLNNELGMHGGSLGSQTNPQQVMENIYKMYELGGVTAIDVDRLMTAVINCGDAMIGSQFRQPLQDYLLAGAALIMFDDSFALSENFLKSMNTKLKGQKVVNIYRLSTRYVPSSFILDEIYSNLIQIYSQLEAEQHQINRHNKVTITNNVTEDVINIYKNQTPEQQWESIRIYTESNIKIQFSFMGGLLDILDKIPDAFNIK